MRRLALAVIALVVSGAEVRRVREEELPEALREPGWIESIEKETVRRLRDGEWDHLIYYALQSTRFTKLPAIEPAVSARAWREKGGVPEDAARRLKAFVEAPAEGERHRALRELLGKGDIDAEYVRAMTFLYEKEWGGTGLSGQARRDQTAKLYQTRGHSTDTSPVATFGVYTGLALIKEMAPGTRVRRVLLVGPGLDWAPRTGFHEDAPPRSYQPYMLADSLVRLGLSRAEELEIDCADINPRVIEYVRGFPESARRIPFSYPRGDAEWNGYFDGIGAAVGRGGAEGSGRFLEVRAEVARRIRPVMINVLTQRVDPGGSYDLAVATNVLLYFSDRELGLAFANLGHALKSGGRLLHNDLRPAVDAWGRTVGLPPRHARTVRVDPRRELYDGVVLHERE